MKHLVLLLLCSVGGSLGLQAQVHPKLESRDISTNRTLEPGVLPDKPCPTFGIDPPAKPIPAPPMEAVCLIINKTSKPIAIEILDEKGVPMDQQLFPIHTLAVGDTFTVATFPHPTEMLDPGKLIGFRLAATTQRWLRDVSVDVQNPVLQDIDPRHRRYFYSISKTKRAFY